MLKKIAILTAFLALLSACEHENVRGTDDAGTDGAGEVETVDVTEGSQGLGEGTPLENADNGSQTFALSECEPNCLYPKEAIKDPNSLLAQRLVYFDFNSDSIPQSTQNMLIAHAKYLANNAGVVVRIEGHTDERGSREYNLALSEKRAKAVRQFMLLHGARADSIEVHAFGEELPMALGSNEQAWQENRRAELVYDNI